MSFGKNLKNLREKHGIDRKTMAQTFEMPYTTLKNYENDEREPGHSFIIKVAKYFNVSADFLLDNDIQSSDEKIGIMSDNSNSFTDNAKVTEVNEAVAKHLQKYLALNAAGRKKIDEDIDDMLGLPKYQRREASGEPSGFILNRMMSTGNWEELPMDNFEKLKEIAEAARKQSTPVKK